MNTLPTQTVACTTCGRPAPVEYMHGTEGKGPYCSYPCAAGVLPPAHRSQRWTDVAIPFVVLVCLCMAAWNTWQDHQLRDAIRATAAAVANLSPEGSHR